MIYKRFRAVAAMSSRTVARRISGRGDKDEPVMRTMLAQRILGGYVESIDVESYGVVRVQGWCEGAPPDCVLNIDGNRKRPDAIYRVSRPDAAKAVESKDDFLGFMIEFFDPPLAAKIVLRIGSIETVVDVARPAVPGSSGTAYGHLIGTEQVYHRSDIYGFGPPTDHVNPDVLNFALLLPPPVLDFGCGSGALVRELRQRGIEAYGIEIDRQPISRALIESVAPHIKLYDGKFPLPFEDGQFESVVSSEVIEHVEDYERALAEIARVTRRRFGITVPDMSAIPIGSVHGVVPFHLLESTHVNFFSCNSLQRVLTKWFRSVRLYRLAPGLLNGSFLPGSLGAIAEK